MLAPVETSPDAWNHLAWYHGELRVANDSARQRQRERLGGAVQAAEAALEVRVEQPRPLPAANP